MTARVWALSATNVVVATPLSLDNVGAGLVR